MTLATAAAPSAAPPPVTLAEFTLAGSSSGDQDFYDVSLVDGYNVGVGVRPSSAAATAGTRGARRMAGATAAYSYAYDDVTSTITCAAGTAVYVVTFCPSYADFKS